MKNLILCALCGLAFASCKKSNSANSSLVSGCLSDRIEAFKSESHAVSILTTFNNGEQVYKFRTVEGCGDGETVNENCEVVCCGGKCTGPRTNCPDKPYSEWTIVWEK